MTRQSTGDLSYEPSLEAMSPPDLWEGGGGPSGVLAMIAMIMVGAFQMWASGASGVGLQIWRETIGGLIRVCVCKCTVLVRWCTCECVLCVRVDGGRGRGSGFVVIRMG